MRCSFLLFTTAVIASAKRLCLYDVPHSRQQRNALIQPTIEELLHELVSSDSSHFHDAPNQELKDRAAWLIRIFEIGMAENKRTLLKKQEMLRYFRETARVFSPRTNIVEFANNVVPQLENVAKKIKTFGYEPLEVLRATYDMAFTPEYLENDKEGQLEMIREAIRPAAQLSTRTTTTTTTTTTAPTHIYFPREIEILELIGDEKSEEEEDNDFGIQAGEIEIDDGPANMVLAPRPTPRPTMSQAPPIPLPPQCLDLERCNGQGECQSRIEGLYMTEEEECACFEGFTGPTCSEFVLPETIPDEPQSSLLSSSTGRSLAIILIVQFLGIFF